MEERKNEVREAYVTWLARRMAVHDQIEALKQSVTDEMLALFAAHCSAKADDVVLVEGRWYRLVKPNAVTCHAASQLPQFEWTADVVNSDGSVQPGQARVGAVRLTFSPEKLPYVDGYGYEIVRRPRPAEKSQYEV